MAQLKLELVVDDKGVHVVDKLGASVGDLGRKSQAAFLSAGKASEQMNSYMEHGLSLFLRLATAAGAFAGAYIGIRALTDNIKSWTEASGKQEAAEAKLQAVLQATGHASGFTINQLSDLASAYQSVTTVEDDVILNGMAIMSSFTNIRGDGFKRATMAALDLAEVMGKDVNAAMLMVGKALNDPAEGLDALAKAGVRFTEAQKNVIEELVATSRAAQAQEMILARLEATFGGTATAAAQTFAGAQKQLANAYGDLEEELGNVITKNSFFIDLLKVGKKWLEEVSEEVKNNRDQYMNLAKQGVLYLADVIIATIEVVRIFANAWGGLRIAAHGAIQGISLAAQIAYETIRLLLIPIELVYAGLVKLGAVDVNPFAQLSEGIALFRASAEWGLDETIDNVLTVDDTFRNASETVKNLQSRMAEIPSVATSVGDSGEKAGKRSSAAFDQAGESVMKYKDFLKEVDRLHKEALKSVGLDVLPNQGERLEKLLAEREKENEKMLEEAEKMAAQARKSIGMDEMPDQGKMLEQALKDPDKVFGPMEDKLKGMISLTERTAEAMEQNFSDLFFDVMQGKFTSLGDYAKAIFQSMQKAASDYLGQMATNFLFGQETTGKDQKRSGGILGGLFGGGGGGGGGGIGGMLGGLFGGGGGAGMDAGASWLSGLSTAVVHAGGVIGMDSLPERMVPAAAMAGAKRYHEGLASDEIPAILQKGETVTPKGGGGGGGITVNINNNAGADVSATQSPDGKTLEIMIERKVQETIRRNPGVVADAWTSEARGGNRDLVNTIRRHA